MSSTFISSVGTFGTRLRQLRMDKGYSTTNLGLMIGVTPQTINNWEMNRTSPSEQNIQNIADVFRVEKEYLTDGIKEEAVENTVSNKPEPVTVEIKTATKDITDELRETRAEEHKRLSMQEPKVFNKRDKRILEDLEVIIKHLPDLKMSKDEKKSLYLTVSELRNDYESKVLFGE